MPNRSFMDALRQVRQEYRPQWRVAQGADQLDDGKRILAALTAAIVRERPDAAHRGYSFEQASVAGREAIIANTVRATDAALRATSRQRFWEAGDAVFTLISGPVDREARRAGRPTDE